MYFKLTIENVQLFGKRIIKKKIYQILFQS